jgi:hypothetical protein
MQVQMEPILKVDGKNIDLSKVLVIGDPEINYHAETYYTNLTMSVDGAEANIHVKLFSMLDLEANCVREEVVIRNSVRDAFKKDNNTSFEEKKYALDELGEKLLNIFPDGAVRYEGADSIIEFKGLHHNILIELLEDSWTEKVVDIHGNGRYYNEAAVMVDEMIKLWVEYKDK